MKKIIIAIDGPAGSGKTTTAKIVADKLGYVYIDTGAMYRAVALECIRHKTGLVEEEICKIVNKISIELQPSSDGQRTILNGEDVSKEIRSPEVTEQSSPVSAFGCVRKAMVDLQLKLGCNGGVVMDGRDIGSHVFPQAELKIFLVASIDARAKRRTAELSAKGIEFDWQEVRDQIAVRDRNDSTRDISPLMKAKDAIEIDTSDITIDQQAKMILDLAGERM
jgi:cytidylate kinase